MCVANLDYCEYTPPTSFPEIIKSNSFLLLSQNFYCTCRTYSDCDNGLACEDMYFAGVSKKYIACGIARD